MPDFIVNLGCAADGAADFGANLDAKFFAQTSRRYTGCAFAQTQSRGGRAIVAPTRISGDERLQGFKKLKLTGGDIFLPQLLQHNLQENRSPPPFENPCRVLRVGRFKSQPGFGFADIYRNVNLPAATFLRVLPIALVLDVIIQASQQKGTEFALFRLHVAKSVSVQQVGEKSLGEVFRIFRALALPSQKRVERRPVGFAEVLQCFRGSGHLLVRGRQHNAPVGLVESCARVVKNMFPGRVHGHQNQSHV